MSPLRECRDCGLFQNLPEIPDGAAAHCPRCDASLRRTGHRTARKALACAASAAVLFAFALVSPLMDLRTVGRFSNATLFTGPAVLDERNFAELSVVVLATLIVAPMVKLAVTLSVLVGTHLEPPPRWMPWVFGWLRLISPWAMIDVFLLGVLVAYSRMQALAQVDVGPGLIALGGAMLAMVATDAVLDRHEIWDKVPFRIDPGPTDERLLVSCHACELVCRADEGARCPRCRHVLHARKPNSLARAWALVVAAALLYIPANVFPVMTVRRLGRGGPNTILSGVQELITDHLWPLAGIVFLASFVVPIVKIIGIVLMLTMTQRRSSSGLRTRAWLFRIISGIGRWSMIDIFALTTLVALVRMGFIADVRPGLGAIAFCGVVVLTMLATEVLDPRLLWDAAAERLAATERVAAAERVAILGRLAATEHVDNGEVNA